MKTARGDLWTCPADVIGVTTNGVVRANGRLVMGAGVAREARDRHPGLDLLLGGYVRRWGSRVFYVARLALLSFPTKRHWRDRSDLGLVLASARQAVEVADRFALGSVALPPPGCGHGRLRWAEVGPALADVLDDRFTVVLG